MKAGVPARTERLAWTIAAFAVLVMVAVVGYQVGRGRTPEPTVPEMGNAGNSGAGLPTRAPDISRMSPRERFDRLWDRVIRAVESRATDTVMMFAPMALGAYDQLDTVDTDARYHAAMIHLAVGELARAKALADTIAAADRGHLFASMIRGEVAERETDAAALGRAYSEFLANWDAETRANREEYGAHRPILDEFRTRAQANARP